MDIGDTFVNKVGEVYTVVDIHRKGYQDKDVYYHLRCSKCSLDEELYPEPFIILRSNLMKGSLPCGCAKSYRWSREQYETLVKRRCKETMTTLIGFQEWKTYQTRLNLECNIHRESLTATIENFLKKEIRCKSCHLLFRNSTNENYHIDKILSTGKFEEGTIFCRDLDKEDSKGYHYHWKMKCPLCYNDEYTANGLCSGIFTARDQSLKRKDLPCRCGNKFLWSKEQRQYQIEKALYAEGHDTNIEWLDDFSKKKSKSKFKWVCAEGHPNITSATKFVNSGNRCKRCNSSHNGYYPKKCENVDYLYVILLPDNTYKIGRSFTLEERYNNINKEFKKEEYKKYSKGLTVVKEYTGTHQKVFDIEQDILLYLKNKNLRVYKNWTTETFKKEGLNYVLEALVNNENLKSITPFRIKVKPN